MEVGRRNLIGAAGLVVALGAASAAADCISDVSLFNPSHGATCADYNKSRTADREAWHNYVYGYVTGAAVALSADNMARLDYADLRIFIDSY